MSDPADDNHDGDNDEATEGISDEQLPPDLRPGEDNPLAEPLDPDADEDDGGMSLEDRIED